MRPASGRGKIGYGAHGTSGGHGGKGTDERPAGGQGRLAIFDTTRRGFLPLLVAYRQG
jgi:hypothetical protein